MEFKSFSHRTYHHIQAVVIKPHPQTKMEINHRVTHAYQRAFVAPKARLSSLEQQRMAQKQYESQLYMMERAMEEANRHHADSYDNLLYNPYGRNPFSAMPAHDIERTVAHYVPVCMSVMLCAWFLGMFERIGARIMGNK
jgi:molybdopterin-biosynthesis enzyme MoeA-like protein